MQSDNIMKKSRMFGLGALALAALGTLGLAQIKEYSLQEMVDEVDDAVWGEIVAKRTFRVDHPIDGPELYYTTLTIQGASMADGSQMTVDVTYHGGFISETEGVYNSEAPVADDVKIGNAIVAFYKWDDMGGGVQANGLFAAHGGLYRTATGPKGPVVLGRGAGYAVPRNVKVSDLSTAVTTLHEAKLERERKAQENSEER